MLWKENTSVHFVPNNFLTEKQMGRNQFRKGVPLYNAAKSENSVDESFEDLLSRYKQIQLELECIRKEETMALEPKVSPSRDVPRDRDACVSVEEQPKTEQASGQSPGNAEETAEKKVFQAFNIKPLRPKVQTNLDELKKKWAEQAEATDNEKGGESGLCKL